MSGRIRFHTPWLDLSGDAEAGEALQVPTWVSAAFLGFGVLSVVVVVLAVGGSAEAFGVLITGPLVLAAMLYGARRLSVIDRNPDLVPIIMGGLCLKLIGTLVRYWVSSGVYGTGDFYDYDKRGRVIASAIRHGHLVTLPGRLAGTNFMRLLTGYIYAFTPSRLMSGFVVYSFLSFIGLLFFWRAYRIAISPQHDVRYLTWLMLMPSLLYWPSAIGKDAFMVLAAGVAAYGVACLLTNRTTTGVVSISLGIGGMVMVRPHFALAVCGGLALAVIVRKQSGGFIRTIVSLAFIVGLGMIVVQSASSFFGISAFNQSSVVQTLNDASARTSDGGSTFTPVVVSSPANVPLAVVTVLFRPLPFEAHSPQEVLTALEGLALIALSIRALKRSIVALRHGRQYPYFMYCLGAILVFSIAFSGFSNFGLLARERGVIQPLLLVFLSLPPNMDRFFGEQAGKKYHKRAHARWPVSW